MKPYRFVFLAILSAVLLTLSFPMPNLWILSWVAFIPFFLAIRDKNFINTFLLGFLAGVVFFYSTVSWLNSIAVLAAVALVLYLALYFAVFAIFAAAILKRNLPIFFKCIFIASGWVALEFIRSNLFTGFGWNLLGYSQAGFLPAIQIADITGVWGVSFIVMFVNVMVYEFFFVGARRAVPLLLCLLLIAAVFIYGFYRLLTTSDKRLATVKVSLIQGNIPQTLKWDESYRQEIIKTYLGLTQQALKDKPDLIIWPETSFPADLSLEQPPAAGSYLLIGANRFEGSRIYNSAFLIAPDGKIIQYYDKLRLVPFGEYMPRIPKFMYKFLPEKINMVGDFTAGKDYTVFNVGANGRSPLQFSVLICFEDVFPQLSRRFVKNGARFLVNITNDGWYGVSAAPFQHAQASVFRAVENRVPVVRAANTGYSVFIDRTGRITDRIEPFTAGYKTKEIFFKKIKS